MTQIKNKSTKRITFPDISFSIGPKEEKGIDECLLDKVLLCQDISRIEIKKKEVYKSKYSKK